MNPHTPLRSRNGCSTCRRRRVKCDEELPVCLRCVKANITCEGYTDSRAQKTRKGVVKPYQRVLILPKHAASTSGLSRILPTGILPKETDIENRYLCYFEQQTTQGFECSTDWTLWNRLVLQGCHHHTFIRHSTIAIAALHKSLRISSGGRGGSKLQREYAYMTFAKALSGIQTAIQGHQEGPRLALISCLLVVCFETLAQNRYQAVGCALAGMKILEDWIVKSEPRHAKWHKLSTQSPLPSVIEDEVVEAFRNLDIQVSTVTDGRTMAAHETLCNYDSQPLKSMPEHFSTLDEARHYWNTVMRRMCHFIATSIPHTQAGLTHPPVIGKPGSVTVTMGDNIFNSSWRVDETFIERQQPYFKDIIRWTNAFDSLYNSTTSGRHGESPSSEAAYSTSSTENTSCASNDTSASNSRAIVVASLLRMHALAARILISGILFTAEVPFDIFMPEFREIINICTIIASIRQSSPDHLDFWSGSYTLDLGIITPLFYLVMRCRDPVLRRKAIKILDEWQLEGWWDPKMIAAMGRCVMELEEEGMIDGWIPETARVTLTAKNSSPGDRQVTLQFMRRTGGPDGGPVWLERHTFWEFPV